jgi:hypothetical protein
MQCRVSANLEPLVAEMQPCVLGNHALNHVQITIAMEKKSPVPFLLRFTNIYINLEELSVQEAIQDNDRHT